MRQIFNIYVYKLTVQNKSVPLRSADSMLLKRIGHAEGNCTVTLNVNDLGSQSNSNWMKINCTECKVINKGQ